MIFKRWKPLELLLVALCLLFAVYLLVKGDEYRNLSIENEQATTGYMNEYSEVIEQNVEFEYKGLKFKGYKNITSGGPSIVLSNFSNDEYTTIEIVFKGNGIATVTIDTVNVKTNMKRSVTEFAEETVNLANESYNLLKTEIMDDSIEYCDETINGQLSVEATTCFNENDITKTIEILELIHDKELKWLDN